MDILRELRYLIWSWFANLSAKPGFWPGVIVGVVGFAITAYTVFTIRVWWGNVTAPFRPQKVTHTTSATPAQVTGGSCKSLLLGLAAFACIVFALISLLFPEALSKLLRVLGL